MVEPYNNYFASSVEGLGYTAVSTERFQDNHFKGFGIMPDSLRVIRYDRGPVLPWSTEGINGEYFVYDPKRIKVKVIVSRDPSVLVLKAKELQVAGWSLRFGELGLGSANRSVLLAHKRINCTCDQDMI